MLCRLHIGGWRTGSVALAPLDLRLRRHSARPCVGTRRPATGTRKARLGLGGGNQPLSNSLFASRLAAASNRLRLLTGFALRGLFVGLALPHLPKDALALHLLLEKPERLVDIVVTHQYLQNDVQSYVLRLAGGKRPSTLLARPDPNIV